MRSTSPFSPEPPSMRAPPRPSSRTETLSRLPVCVMRTSTERASECLTALVRASATMRYADCEVAVVVLSQHVQRRYASELIGQRDGGVGYLLKQRIADVRAFTADLRHVQAGGTVLDPDVVAVLVARASKLSGPVGDLTPRQLEVLGLMAEGRSNSHIAARLGSSEKAVVHHTSNIYDTFGLPVAADDHRRVLAVVRYLAAAGDLDGGAGIH